MGPASLQLAAAYTFFMLFLESKRLGRITALGFSALALVIVVQGIFGGWGLYRLHQELTSALVNLSDAQVEALELNVKLVTLRKFEKDILLNYRSVPDRRIAEARWEEMLTSAMAQLEFMAAEVKLSGLKTKSLVPMTSALRVYGDGVRAVTMDMDHGTWLLQEQATEAMAVYKKGVYDMEAALREVVDGAERLAQETLEDLEHRRNILLLLMGTISLLSLVAGAALSVKVVRSGIGISRTLEYQSMHDTLTGLSNRRGMVAWLNARGGQSATLAYLDLDRFKLINDLCGHTAGDDLLLTLTQKMNERCVALGCVMARVGGDEFAIWMVDVDMTVAKQLATELVQMVEDQPFEWRGQRMELGASVGLAVGRVGFIYTEVISRADAACRLAKSPGSAKVLLYEETDPSLVESRRQEQWAAKLPQLIHDGRFVLYGQHIVPLRPSAGLGHVEVLIRGLDAEGKPLSPGLFLPAAERFGLMPKIDRWVIETLLRSDLDDSFHYAINLSGQTLADNAYLPILETLLRESGKAHLLTFEITESAAMTSIDTAREYVRRLKALGCRFSLDDFGSGFSSFAYLRDLQVDYLKIDGSLIRILGRNESDAALVRAIVHMADALGLKTIAEFVETPELATLLAGMSIDFGQGYGIHKPEPLSILKPLTAVAFDRSKDVLPIQ